jgi:hypothetical protein
MNTWRFSLRSGRMLRTNVQYAKKVEAGGVEPVLPADGAQVTDSTFSQNL